ncbi:hypothetical protein V1264_023904 [Littorina saxatilis]|uniref:Uncharacterized protein n=1 Tax=Littorina saxatilis TaxID=31220 RepID=A0AAN9G9W8_9CAEN
MSGHRSETISKTNLDNGETLSNMSRHGFHLQKRVKNLKDTIDYILDVAGHDGIYSVQNGALFNTEYEVP